MSFIEIEGELHWCRTDKPETDPWNNTKWKATIYPTQEAMPKVMDLQAQGCRNTLKKDDKGYYVTFSRPVEIKNKSGAVVQRLEKPKVVKADGVTPIEGLIGNGSKGVVRLELRSYKTPQGGTGHSARLDAIKVTELIPYGDTNQQDSNSAGWGS
jgi:hypothetical protein